MLQLFFACLLGWVAIIGIFFALFSGLISGFLNGLLGLLLIAALIPAFFTVLILRQSDQINQLEKRISELEQTNKENHHD